MVRSRERGRGLYDEVLALARQTPCDPRTLTRAARDLAEAEPAFAVGAGSSRYTGSLRATVTRSRAPTWAAYSSTMKAAEMNGSVTEIHERIRELVAGETSPQRFLTKILGPKLGLC